MPKTMKKSKQRKNQSSVRNHKIDSTAPTLAYVDLAQNGSVSTTVTVVSLLSSLLGSGGLMNSFAQYGTPVQIGSQIRTRVRLRLVKLEFNMRTVGSQSNTIVSGDLYNTVRYVVYRTGETYQSGNINALVNVDFGLNTLDIEEVYIDNVDCLPSQAYDTASSYNVPDVRYHKFGIDLNVNLDCFSTTAPGTAGVWETRSKDLNLEIVSDSNTAPNPLYFFNARIFFKVVK